MAKLHSNLSSAPCSVPVGLRHFYSLVHALLFFSSGCLIQPPHLPEWYVYSVNLWVDVSWLANTARACVGTQCLLRQHCRTVPNPVHSAGTSQDTHNAYRAETRQHVPCLLHMQIISQKVVHRGLTSRWCTSLPVQSRLRCAQADGSPWCIIKAMPTWTSAETGLWWIHGDPIHWELNLMGLMGSSGTWTSSPALHSAWTDINYPIPLTVPAQEVAETQKTILKQFCTSLWLIQT